MGKVVTMFRHEIREADCGSGWLWRIYSIVNSINWLSLATNVYQMSYILPRHMKQASNATSSHVLNTGPFLGSCPHAALTAAGGGGHHGSHVMVTEREIQVARGSCSGLVRTSEKTNYVLSLLFSF